MIKVILFFCTWLTFSVNALVSTDLPDVTHTYSYKTVHVDTEGGDFVAGGNGIYINNLILAQIKKLSDKEKIALITPAYTPDGKAFDLAGYKPFSFIANIYDRNGLKKKVRVNYWLKSTSENVHFYAIEPDENHKDFFTTAVTEQGTIKEIRTIPDRMQFEQNTLKTKIKTCVEKIKSLSEEISGEDITSAKLPELIYNFQQMKSELYNAEKRQKEICGGYNTEECSLFSRNAHFHELSAALIDYLQDQGITISVVHTHDYGNTMQYVKSKNMATVNTFHSEPGRGFLPWYLHKKSGKRVAQRGIGMVSHHILYTVSPEYEEWLINGRSPNAKYSISMYQDGRVTYVTSIPDKDLHGFHAIVPFLEGYCSENDFLQMSVRQKKELARQILSDKIKVFNKEYHFDPSKKTLLFLGRILKSKGSEFLKDIIELAEALDCNVLICGYLTQYDYEFSEQLVEKLKTQYPWVPFFIGRDEQSFLGSLHRAAADINVCMSFNESFGLAYSEALCYGSHCVISDVGGSRSAVLNNPECATMVPLYWGNDIKYLRLQEKIFNLKNKLLECGQNQDELKNNLRVLKDELNNYCIKKASLTNLFKKHFFYKNKMDAFDTVNYEKTREALKFYLFQAYEKLCDGSICAERIYYEAMNGFSKEQWLSEIENVYDKAKEILKAQEQSTLVLQDAEQDDAAGLMQFCA